MLTEQKKKFAEALMSGRNQTESAVIAGYSEASAKQRGYKLSKDGEVLAYIERSKDRYSEIDRSNTGNQEVIQGNPSVEDGDPIEFLQKVMTGKQPIDDLTKIQIEAAKALLPYLHSKVVEVGKKESKEQKAKNKAQGNKYGSLKARLEVVK